MINLIFVSENGDIPTKTSALKKTIQLILSGERLPGILMTVIRFVMPLEDHTIKKLLLVFWEIVPKTTGEGKLLQEMILVCDAYRKVFFLFCIKFQIYVNCFNNHMFLLTKEDDKINNYIYFNYML